MEIQGLQALYAGHKSVKALVKALQDGSARTIFAEGLCASAAPLLFSSVAAACPQVMACPYVFVLDDAEEAGYFYHDLTQILGEQEVFYFPSSFRRAVKFGQRDAANEILRTEVISRLSAGHRPLFVVTYPEAVMEKVVSRQKLNEQTLRLPASGWTSRSWRRLCVRSVSGVWIMSTNRGSLPCVAVFSMSFHSPRNGLTG